MGTQSKTTRENKNQTYSEVANIRCQWVILKTHEERKASDIYFVFAVQTVSQETKLMWNGACIKEFQLLNAERVRILPFCKL